MCNLCSSDLQVKETARKHLHNQAEYLEDFARLLRGMACGMSKPHKDNDSRMTLAARSIIRFLVEEYM